MRATGKILVYKVSGCIRCVLCLSRSHSFGQLRIATLRCSNSSSDLIAFFILGSPHCRPLIDSFLFELPALVIAGSHSVSRSKPHSQNRLAKHSCIACRYNYSNSATGDAMGALKADVFCFQIVAIGVLSRSWKWE